MISKVKYKFTKNLDNVIRAARCDAVMRRPNDNPYRPGTAEAALYNEYYAKTQGQLEADDIKTGKVKIDWKTRIVRRNVRRYFTKMKHLKGKKKPRTY
jgi:hypothetical protein